MSKARKANSPKKLQERTVRARAAFLEGIRAGCSICRAAKRAGVDRERYYFWRKHDEEFAADADQAMREAITEGVGEANDLQRNVVKSSRYRIEVRLEAARGLTSYAAKMAASLLNVNVRHSGVVTHDVKELGNDWRALCKEVQRPERIASYLLELEAQHQAAKSAGGNGGSGGGNGNGGNGHGGNGHGSGVS